MTKPLHRLALALTLTTLSAAPLSAAALHAQITSPDTLVAPAPQPPQQNRPASEPEDLQWLWPYTQPAPSGNKAALLADPKFPAMLKLDLRTPQSFWGINRTLADAASAFLAGKGSVAGTKERYITITGCVAGQCGQRGLLWVDTDFDHPLVIFCALRWNEDARTSDDPKAPFTLYIIPSQPIDAQHPPEMFKLALGLWVYGPDYSLPTNIVQTLLLDPDGSPHVLQLRDLDLTPITNSNQ